MRPFLFCALCLAVLFASASPSYAIGRRRGGNMMVCNVAQAQPTQATAQNLEQVAAVRVFRPLAVDSSPVLVSNSRSGVALSALAAMNSRPANPVAAGASQVASK